MVWITCQWWQANLYANLPTSSKLRWCYAWLISFYKQQRDSQGNNYIVPYCHDFLQSWSLSLFGQHSAVEVTDFLAIADPLFIFLWFCLVLYHTWFQSHSLHVVYLTLCSPSLSLSVIVCLWALCNICLVCDRFCSHLFFKNILVFGVFEHLFNCSVYTKLDLLRLTSLPPAHTLTPVSYKHHRAHETDS